MTDGRDGPQGALVRAAQPWTDPSLARLYDAFPFPEDVPLDLGLASAQGGEVLELACGSGRARAAAQLRQIRSIYEVIDPKGGTVTKRIVEWPFRWVHRFEAELLLERAGFEVEQVHGGHQGEPFTSRSRVMLLLARVRS
jgi:hypothetical protein